MREKVSQSFEVQPWLVPNCVIFKMPSRPRQDGIPEAPKLALSECDSATLAQMCDAFRAEVFRKAGKSDPSEAPPEVEATKKAEAEVTALREERDALKREVGLTHERLDELDQHRPLFDFIPDIIDQFFYRAEAAERRVQALEAILRWLQGEEGNFPKPPDDGRKFYWRKELRQRIAALTPAGPEEPLG